jgi:hypothetical protein
MTHESARFSRYLMLVAGCASILSCSRHQSPRDQKQVDPISQTAPQFKPIPRPALLPRATLVASSGDCAPKYANGWVGSCINNQPCRGFGVLGENGKAECACFARTGGCGPGDRCDWMKKACVPEKTPGFGRAPSD